MALDSDRLAAFRAAQTNLKNRGPAPREISVEKARCELILDAEVTYHIRARRGVTRAQALLFTALYHLPDWQELHPGETWEREAFIARLAEEIDGQVPAMPRLPELHEPRPKRSGHSRETVNRMIAVALPLAAEHTSLDDLAQAVAKSLGNTATPISKGTATNILYRDTRPEERRYLAIMAKSFHLSQDLRMWPRVYWPLLREILGKHRSFSACAAVVEGQLGASENVVGACVHRYVSGEHLSEIRRFYPEYMQGNTQGENLKA